MHKQELWVIDCFVNSQWFCGKFQLKICWEDQTEEQDDWCNYSTILKESTSWQEQLEVTDNEVEDPVRPMLLEYYT